ncbi:hypothetical protein CAP40_13525 [Sphingomonas sp. IBVSS2]|uniref:GH92 family glycosyl hydrolase n=1 Tax=Sphingomonas sp. IBVSS2 TaxID=1985172 RepID=UPI000A2DF7F6|nr:GH92 family glycosyl hydrolase [Sphingomonas sp. IBVSS2]OSZ66856.1 hypothetical protein CAP40_13525 [Sphingomonas sp. IBVSS2]
MTRRTGMRFAVAALLPAIGAGAREAPVAATPGEDLLAYVDPLIGTGGNGHTFPGATVPFGMVQLSPSNDRNGWNWTSGYHYSDADIKGFAHTHISGAGLSALGDILLMPTRAPSTEAGSAERPGSGYRSRFSHARELARPGYYRVHLDDPDVDAELTATVRAGFHRYAYRGDAARYVVIDPTHSVGDHSYRTEVEIVSDREIRGWKRAISQSSGDRSVFFVARFSQPFASAKLTEDDRPVAGRARAGRAIKALVQFAPGDGDSIEVAVALSHTGRAGAQANFDADARGRTFDAALADATRLWQERLSRITIEGDARQKRLFYTAAYHAAIAPNLISDVTGTYYLDGKVRQSRIPQFSNFSNWDTYRALHPLLTIIDTKKDGEIVASMVSRHAEQGLLLPSWEAVGHDNRVMIGYSIVSPIADAVLKGIPGVDPEAAYAAIRASAFDTTKHSNVYDANGMAGYLAYGFVPADVASSVSKTTEQNYEDWAIGRVAEKLGKRADAALFARRATGWRQLYDPANGYLLPRLADGSRVPVPMDTWDTLNRHYVSGNIWAYSSYTPHDMIAAIRLHGGREAYARWLEGIFTDTRPIGGEQHVDISGFVGRYAHGDEPGHHMAWLFNLVGEPWLTQLYVNRLVREMYADRPDGLVNNEDLGQMSAWYLLATLGFYPVAPGDLTYQITAPHHRRATIALENGKRFVIEAGNLTPENIFVQSATLDGKPYPHSYIRHERIMAGGVLRFEMGPKPNRAWGSDPRETSLGAFDDKVPAEVPHRAAWAPFDPDATAYFAGSRAVDLQTAEPGAVIRYTLDGREPDGRSRRYAGPLRISHDTVLKAVALREGLATSTIFEKHYARAATVGLGPGYPRIAIAEPDMPYGRADGAMLIDQQRGTRFYGDKKWSGRLGDITATIDLGRSRPVRSVTIGYLDDPMNGILVPRRIEIWAGSEAGALSLVGSRDVAAPRAIRQAVDRLRIPVRGSFRQYQVRVLSAGTMPPGLSPPGRKAWLFLDEILLQ